MKGPGRQYKQRHGLEKWLVSKKTRSAKSRSV